MINVTVREKIDPWVLIMRACARVAATHPNTREHQLAKRQLKAFEDVYRLNDPYSLSKNRSRSIGVR